MRRVRGREATVWTLAAGLALGACGDGDGGGGSPSDPSIDPSDDAVALVQRLDLEAFKDDIRDLAAFGDREQGSESNLLAGAWIGERLASFGYEVVRHPFTFEGEPRENIYATKVGATRPDEMYMISAHFDGRGGGGGADDDGSGTALVLQAARVFAAADVETEASVRFILWDAEEVGLVGSTAYVQDRVARQGREDPPGSGEFPEPVWLGIVQHDMILFDHGIPPQDDQRQGADIDVEYQVASAQTRDSRALALALRDLNPQLALAYPAQVGNDMCCTDSWPFRNFTAAVSVRENRRRSEIGNGSNPHWHQPTDVFATYSDADFRLGLDALRTTVGTIATLAEVTIR